MKTKIHYAKEGYIKSVTVTPEKFSEREALAHFLNSMELIGYQVKDD